MIQENTNTAILYNSIVLYMKMGVSTICGLLTTRFSLRALGVTDFGLFSILGGIISFIAIINTIQLSTSNRFIAVAIGKGDLDEINQQFNVNLIIHVLIAIITAMFAFPIGNWYITHYLNYSGDLHNAIIVFSFTVTASIISFIGVPYNGLLMAKERFAVFSLIEAFAQISKLVFTWFLVDHWEDKLLLYTIVFSILSCYQVPVYYVYCKRKWPSLIRPRIVKDKEKYKEVFSFSSWVAYGSVAVIAKSQGASVVINLFFNTVMNTALGLANTVNSFIVQFTHNVTQPIAPQITKSFASGDMNRTNDLLVLSTKVAYISMFIISAPFFIDAEWILGLWLGDVPPYTVLFVKLLIIDGLISSFNSGISSIIFASGNIRLYQLSVNTIRIVAVLVAFFVLRKGAPPFFLFYVYILFSLIVVFVIQVVLNKTLHYDNRELFKRSYLPSMLVTLLFLPFVFLPIQCHPLVTIISGEFYCFLLVWFIGLSGNERKRFESFVIRKIFRK